MAAQKKAEEEREGGSGGVDSQVEPERCSLRKDQLFIRSSGGTWQLQEAEEEGAVKKQEGVARKKTDEERAACKKKEEEEAAAKKKAEEEGEKKKTE